MSWSQWPVGATPALAGVINPAPAVINPSTGVINPAAAVMPVGSQYTPEQWTQMQQQNWQQWAQWQQQYQQWHQQYGAEVFFSIFSVSKLHSYQFTLHKFVIIHLSTYKRTQQT